MIRNLLIISGAGLVLAIVGVGGSIAVGGADLARHSYTWAFDDEGSGALNLRRTAPEEVEPAKVKRDLQWDGRDSLSISLPGEVIYVQTSENPGITVTGPRQMVDRVSYTSGHLMITDHDREGRSYVTWGPTGIHHWSTSDGLKVVIRAPSVKAFDLRGKTDLQVQGYDQPDLDLTLTGSSDIEVFGRADRVKVDASGNSSAELDELIGSDAEINASGDAGVKTAANGKVIINASGLSRIRLTRRPTELQQTLTEDVDIRQD